jgi:hypothetical protein
MDGFAAPRIRALTGTRGVAEADGELSEAHMHGGSASSAAATTQADAAHVECA